MVLGRSATAEAAKMKLGLGVWGAIGSIIVVVDFFDGGT